MKRCLAVTCLIGMLFAKSSYAQAQKPSLALLPVEGTNLSESDTRAMGELMQATLESIAAQQAVIPYRQTTAAAQQGADRQQLLAQLGAVQYVALKAIKLGEKIVITGTLLDAKGELLHTVKMKAASLDDFEQVADRIGRALLTRTSIEQARTLSNISHAEGKKKNRLFSEKIFGIKTSLVPVFAIGQGQKFDMHGYIGFNGRLEAERYFLEFGIGGFFPTNAVDDGLKYGGMSAELGACYYLTNKNVSWYLGGGIMPGFVGGDLEPVFRFSPYGQTGLMFFRQSSSRLYVDLRVAQHVVPMKEYEYDYLTDSSKTEKFLPTELYISVGVGW